MMRLKIALHPSAAVEIRDPRARWRTAAHGIVDSPRNRTPGSGNGDVLDARDPGRRLVHQLHHRPELLPQLGQWREVARHADRLDELTDDLRLWIHRAAAPRDTVACEQLQRFRLAHGGVL